MAQPGAEVNSFAANPSLLTPPPPEVLANVLWYTPQSLRYNTLLFLLSDNMTQLLREGYQENEILRLIDEEKEKNNEMLHLTSLPNNHAQGERLRNIIADSIRLRMYVGFVTSDKTNKTDVHQSRAPELISLLLSGLSDQEAGKYLGGLTNPAEDHNIDLLNMLPERIDLAEFAIGFANGLSINLNTEISESEPQHINGNRRKIFYEIFKNKLGMDIGFANGLPINLNTEISESGPQHINDYIREIFYEIFNNKLEIGEGNRILQLLDHGSISKNQMWIYLAVMDPEKFATTKPDLVRIVETFQKEVKFHPDDDININTPLISMLNSIKYLSDNNVLSTEAFKKHVNDLLLYTHNNIKNISYGKTAGEVWDALPPEAIPDWFIELWLCPYQPPNRLLNTLNLLFSKKQAVERVTEIFLSVIVHPQRIHRIFCCDMTSLLDIIAKLPQGKSRNRFIVIWIRTGHVGSLHMLLNYLSTNALVSDDDVKTYIDEYLAAIKSDPSKCSSFIHNLIHDQHLTKTLEQLSPEDINRLIGAMLHHHPEHTLKIILHYIQHMLTSEVNQTNITDFISYIETTLDFAHSLFHTPNDQALLDILRALPPSLQNRFLSLWINNVNISRPLQIASTNSCLESLLATLHPEHVALLLSGHTSNSNGIIDQIRRMLWCQIDRFGIGLEHYITNP